jgi:DNA-binding transcriptional LysR family regulator
VTDTNNPLAEVIRKAQAHFEDLHARIGVYDYLDCLTELRAGRLDIAFVGISQDEQVPGDVETCHVYDEVSGLFCRGEHACAKANDPETLDVLLKESKISAHSFLLNPIDEDLDMRLLEEESEQSQGNIETTTYLTLAGSHVGLIPVHFANFWAKEGQLVELAPERYRVISEIHALRLRNQTHETAAQWFWENCIG